MPATITARELRERANKLLEEADEIQAKSLEGDTEMSAEDLAALDEKIADAKKLREQADRMQKIEDLRTGMNTDLPRRTDPGEPTSTIPAEPKDADEEARMGFEDLGEFAFTTVRAALGHGVDSRLIERTKVAPDGSPRADIGTLDGPAAGYLLPPAFRAEIWNELAQMPGSILGLLDDYPIEGGKLEMLGNAETSRANGSRYGGVNHQWLGEDDTMTPTEPKVRAVDLEPHDLAVFTRVKNRAFRRGNAAALTTYLKRAAVDELDFAMTDSVVNGNGVAKPFGILKSAALITIAKETSQAADSVLYENVVKMMARLNWRGWSRSVWLCHQTVHPWLHLFYLAVKNAAGDENVGGIRAGAFDPNRMTLFNRPILTLEQCPPVGDPGDLILADLKSYAFGKSRQGMEEASSIHLYFDSNKTAFRWIVDLDGQPWPSAPLTPYQGTDTLSPFVAIAART